MQNKEKTMSEKIVPQETLLDQTEADEDQLSLNADIARVTGVAEGNQLLNLLEDSGIILDDELKAYIKWRFEITAKRAFQLGTYENKRGENNG